MSGSKNAISCHTGFAPVWHELVCVCVLLLRNGRFDAAVRFYLILASFIYSLQKYICTRTSVPAAIIPSYAVCSVIFAYYCLVAFRACTLPASANPTTLNAKLGMPAVHTAVCARGCRGMPGTDAATTTAAAAASHDSRRPTHV